MTKKIAVIGGGISGLSTTYFLEKNIPNDWSVELFEANAHLGGSIQTHLQEDFLLEFGPHTLRSGKQRRALDDLCSSLMLDQEKVILSKPLRKYIQFQGKIHPFPKSIAEWFKSPLLKNLKLPLLLALFYTKKNQAPLAISVEDFFSTRLGKEFVKRLIDPICRGIWASSPHELSLQTCFPSLAECDKKNLSLISFLCKQMLSSKWGSSYIYSFSKGLSQLPKKLEEKIKGKVHLQSPVLLIRRKGEKMELITSKKTEIFDHVITTVPSFSLASLLEDSFIEEKKLCQELPYKTVCIVHLGWKQAVFSQKGFGVLAPSCEESELLGSIWTSSLFAKRTPEQKGISLAYLFDASSEKARTKEHFVQKAKEHAETKLMVKLPPDMEREFLAKKAIYCPSPQVEKNLSMLQHSLAVKLPQLTLSGTFLSGVSIYDCVDYAKQTAIAVAKKKKGHLT